MGDRGNMVEFIGGAAMTAAASLSPPRDGAFARDFSPTLGREDGTSIGRMGLQR